MDQRSEDKIIVHHAPFLSIAGWVLLSTSDSFMDELYINGFLR